MEYVGQVLEWVVSWEDGAISGVDRRRAARLCKTFAEHRRGPHQCLLLLCVMEFLLDFAEAHRASCFEPLVASFERAVEFCEEQVGEVKYGPGGVPKLAHLSLRRRPQDGRNRFARQLT